MSQTVFVFIIVVIGIILLAGLVVKPIREKVGQKVGQAGRGVVGICQVALEQTTRKQANKQKAFALLENRGELGNEEIREELGVSRQSVVRYLNELEKEGKVEQVGDSGRGVTYRLK